MTEEPIIHIIPFDQKRSFNKEQADQFVDLLLTITRKCRQEITILNAQLESNSTAPFIQESIQQKSNERLRMWSEKLFRLGMTPIALWKVNIPSEEGQDFIWEFPNDQVFRKDDCPISNPVNDHS